MIISIQHKGLKRLWTKNDESKLPRDQVAKIRLVLSLLNAADKITDMNFPGSSLHRLKGDLKDYWAVSVKANWRIIFKFEKGNVQLVDYVDYH
jgi:proteic killer suppression protein